MQLSFAVSDGAAQRAARTSQLTFDPNEMYIERAGTAPPTGGHGHAAPGRPALRPLDPIDPGLVGKVNYTAVFDTARLAATTGIKWAERLESYLKDGFPRTRDLDSRSPGRPKSKADCIIEGAKAEATLLELQRAGIIKHVDFSTEGTPRERTWATVFQVPKTEKVDRAIINCKDLNVGFEKPPPLALAEISALIGLVRYFGDAILSVADIRHFFWQLRLAPVDRRYFSFSGRRAVFECIALAMGWSWSPWTAQGIAGLVMFGAVQRLQVELRKVRKDRDVTLIAQPGGAVCEDSPPPFWFVIEQETKKVIAIVVIWYDNFLVITEREHGTTPRHRTLDAMIRKALDSTMGDFNLQWKQPDRPWTVQRNKCDYIGIHFERDDDTKVFGWRHIAENIESWRAVEPTLQPRMSVIQLARVLGVVTWDAHIRLGIRHATEIRHLMSRVGTVNAKIVAKQAKRDEQMDLTPDELRMLKASWTRLIENPETVFSGDDLRATTFLASDATLEHGAGVFLDGPAATRLVIPFDLTNLVSPDPEEPGAFIPADINVKETWTAVRTVLAALERLPERGGGTLFVIAVDNTTAVSWFNGRTALDEETQQLLQTMDRLLEERGCKAWAVWEPTRTQPADEPSRLGDNGQRKAVVEGKVRGCLWRLKQAVKLRRGAIEVSSFEKSEATGYAKRERDADETE
jgi:hypothetical protein